jgi:hypothetical protein
MIRSMKKADTDLNCVKCQSENVKRRISLFNAASGSRSIAGNTRMQRLLRWFLQHM